MFTQALVEGDPAKRDPLVRDIQETIQRDLAWIPIAETKTLWAYTDKLHGLTWHPDNSLRFFEMSLDK